MLICLHGGLLRSWAVGISLDKVLGSSSVPSGDLLSLFISHIVLEGYTSKQLPRWTISVVLSMKPFLLAPISKRYKNLLPETLQSSVQLKALDAASAFKMQIHVIKCNRVFQPTIIPYYSITKTVPKSSSIENWVDRHLLDSRGRGEENGLQVKKLSRDESDSGQPWGTDSSTHRKT